MSFKVCAKCDFTYRQTEESERRHESGECMHGVYTVVDEPENVDWATLDQRLANIESLFAHADTCPCTHCAHLRANSVSDRHGAGASGPAPDPARPAPGSGGAS